MPQVYRRHSDYAPRPSLVPRRRSVLPPAQATDADDSIVLADLVRTGEASRLRRRGAMRLDHTGPTTAARPPPPARQSSYAPPPTRPVIIAPSRTPSPDRPPQQEEDGQDEYTYTSGPALGWRDWEPRPSTERRGAEVEILGDGGHASQSYVLYCGGEDAGAVVEEAEPPRRFQPALFPGCAPQSPASSSRSQTRAARRTNGCGALIHMRAYPQSTRGVWMAKEEATEAVVGLDAEYCDHPAMDKMLRSACGCVREGIGCAAWCVVSSPLARSG